MNELEIKGVLLRARSIIDADGEVLPITGKLVLEVAPEDREHVKTWLKISDATKPMRVAIKRWYKAKTYDQLKLFWSLVGVMAIQQEGRRTREVTESYYHGMIERYAPVVRGTLPDGSEYESRKTLSEMTTVEASVMVEGAFRELAEMGAPLSEGSQIRNWLIEWREWRSTLKHDELDDTYDSLNDYRARVPYCEATGRPLGTGQGHIAHIVSRGTGGVDEAWNVLHLCPDAHLMTQHVKGWVEFLTRYPHLMAKVNRARERSGKKPLTSPDDLYDDMGAEKPAHILADESKIGLF